VSGEALKINNGTGNGVQAYVACQAAVPAHAYDPSTTIWQTNTPSTPDDFANYPLTGNNYFNGVTSGGSRANFFNQKDYALDWWVTDQQHKPDTFLRGYSYDGTNYWHSTALLTYTNNTYEIFAYCVQSPCFALGATPGVFAPSVDLSTVWNGDPFGKGIYSEHCWHSAEFYFSTIEQWSWWATLKSRLRL
jgi:hypothetical protein